MSDTDEIAVCERHKSDTPGDIVCTFAALIDDRTRRASDDGRTALLI